MQNSYVFIGCFYSRGKEMVLFWYLVFGGGLVVLAEFRFPEGIILQDFRYKVCDSSMLSLTKKDLLFIKIIKFDILNYT